MNVRVTMGSGAAARVMFEGMLSCVKFERKTAPKNLEATNGEQISDLGEKTIGAGWKESAHSKILRRHNGQAGREPRTMDSGFVSMKQVHFSAGRDSE